MDRLSPTARSDQYGSRINREQSPWRAVSVPYITIMVGSLLPFLALADVIPVLPPLGFLLLLGWRIMRPGLLPLWAGVPLGAFDDLFSGQPFGSAILLWSLAMITLELIEARFPWRGFSQDWFTAGLGASAYIFVAMVVSGAQLTAAMMLALIPQVLLAILLYPLIAQIVAVFDRFRLSRARRVS
ncbi:MAG: rod shape-determining protein MreD [Pseudomonadota bacterium]